MRQVFSQNIINNWLSIAIFFKNITEPSQKYSIFTALDIFKSFGILKNGFKNVSKSETFSSITINLHSFSRSTCFCECIEHS